MGSLPITADEGLKTSLFELVVNNDLSISVNVSGYLFAGVLILFVLVIGIKFYGFRKLNS